MRIDWADWAAFKALHKLETVKIIQLPGADTIIMVKPPEEPIPGLGPMSKLATILDNMMQVVTKNPGQPLRRELRGGLRVDMIYGLDGVYRFQASREGVYPSDQEWEILMRDLPEQFKPINSKPSRFTNWEKRKEYFYLRIKT